MAAAKNVRKEPSFEVDIAPAREREPTFSADVADTAAATPGSITVTTMGPTGAGNAGTTPMERMYFAWNDALARNDARALLSLYAEDGVLESPLVPYLLKRKSGVLRGRAELKALFDMLAERKPKVRQYHRSGYLTDGRRMIFEYPRQGAKGDQMDFAEVMELNDEGLIQRHSVYWGWFGVGVLERDEYYR